MQVQVRDTGDLKRLARDLRGVADGKALRKELTQGLRGALRPAQRTVQAAYRASPGYPGRRARSRAQQPPLHLLMARATRVEVRTTGRQAGARLRVDGRRLPDRMKALPRYREGYKPRWRHPVFGDRRTWAAQRPVRLFDALVRPHEREADRAVKRVLDRVRAKLERRR